MSKNVLSIISRILCSIFIIATISILFIAYKKIDIPYAGKFAMGYVFFTFFFILYMIIVTIFNGRKLKWSEIRKRVLKFIVLAVVFCAFNYALDYIFRPSKIGLPRNFSTPIGLSFGICFFDLMFSSKERTS